MDECIQKEIKEGSFLQTTRQGYLPVWWRTRCLN